MRHGRGFPLSTRVLQKPRLTPTKPQGTHGILRLPGRASRLADRAIKGVERGLGQTFISDVFLPYNLSPSLVYRTEVAADQPLRWWHLDDTSGTTAVESIGGNSGTYVGSPTFGDVGLASDAPRATQFVSASSQEVTLPTTNLAPSGVGTWSLEVSFKWPSGGNTVLLRDNTSAGGSGWIVYTLSGFLTVRAGGSDIATSIVDTAARDGKKHLLHVVMANRNVVKIYYDGNLVGSGTCGSNGVATPWHFGRNGTNAGQYTNCTGGDFVLYARELTAERVTAHYNAWLGATSGVTQTSSASLSGSANLATTARVTHNASASPSGSGTIACSARVTRLAASSLSGSGTLAVAALVDHRAASSPSGNGTLAGSANVEHRASASPSGTGTLTCATQVTHPAASSLSGTGTLFASAGTIFLATPPALAGVSNLSATGQVTRSASAALSGDATLACEGTLLSGSNASLTGSATLSALARVEHRGAASLSGSAALAMVTTVEMHPRGLMVSELHTNFHANAIYSATVAGNVLSGSLHVDETLVLGVFDQNYTLLRVVTTDERRLDAQGGVLSEVAVDWSEAISAETDNLIHVHDPEHGATDIDLRPLSVDRTIKGTDVSLSLDGDHRTLRVTDEQIVVV